MAHTLQPHFREEHEMEINELVSQLAETRKKLAKYREAWAEIEERVISQTRETNKNLLEDIEFLKRDEGELNEQIRNDAVIEYSGYPEGGKQIALGVSIRVVSKYEYSPTNALDWAKKTGLCLQLDKTAFDDLCRTSSKPEFVSRVERITATIAKDLDAALEQEDPNDDATD